MRCPRCQMENAGDSAYCKRCGNRLSGANLEPKTSFTRPYFPTRFEPEVGTVFAGRYQVLEELGGGGMGKVYKVVDKEINEKIALKILKPEISLDEKIIERFRNELKLARKISHPNVCRMYDLIKEQGMYFITMEYISGEDLKSTVSRVGQLSVGKTLTIARQICKGLAEAHKMGVVHRDLKPHNIIIDREGDVRILDFGIAHSTKTQGITESGVMIGTPEYMSPEQAVGEEADERSDIYSLGVIMFELLTGMVPFKADTAVGVALKQRTETPPSPRSLNVQIPDSVNRMVLRCLEKERGKRYQKVEDILEEIARILKGHPTTEKILPDKPLTKPGFEASARGRPRAIVLGAILLAIAGVGGYLIFRPSPPPGPTDPDQTQVDRALGAKVIEGEKDKAPVSQGSETGTLDIGSSPAGAGVFLNDEPLGIVTPTGKKTVRSGSYRLRVSLSGYDDAGEDVQIDPGETLAREFELKKTPPPPEASYRVYITTEPSGAAIYLIDGPQTGLQGTTPKEILLSAKSGTLELRKPRYRTLKVPLASLNMKPDVQFTISKTLDPLQVKVTIRTTPPGASLTLDKDLLGSSPIIDRPTVPGKHSLKIEKDGYAPVVKSITVSEKQAVFEETLDPEKDVYVLFSSSGDADMFLDDQPQPFKRSDQRSCDGHIQPGEHEILLVINKPAKKSVRQKLNFDPGKGYRIHGNCLDAVIKQTEIPYVERKIS